MSTASDYHEAPPPPTLAAHVACLWTRTTGDGGADLRARVLPDGCIDIVWVGDAAPGVAGPATRPVVPDLPPRSPIVGVRFWPGMASSVLGVPANELIDADTPLQDVWGAAASRLASRVSEIAAVEARLEAVEAVIVDRLSSAAPADLLVSVMAARIARRPSARVWEISRDAGLSERQLRRRFEAAVGYGPKTLHRVLRFQRWLSLARQPEAGRLGLAGLAMLAGYADQAHMTREVSRLAGVPPTSLLS